MTLQNKYPSLDTVRLLVKAGMKDLMTPYSWTHGEFVRPEIYEKHPGLSDDGYMDLTKKWGGPYEHREVYMKDWRVTRQYPVEEWGNLPAPTFGEAVQWLIENKNVWVTALPDYDTGDDGEDERFVWSWNVRFIDPEDSMRMKTFTSFQTYEHCGTWEQAMGEGLFVAAWALDSIKPEKMFEYLSFNKVLPLIQRIRKAVAGHRKFISKNE